MVLCSAGKQDPYYGNGRYAWTLKRRARRISMESSRAKASRSLLLRPTEHCSPNPEPSRGSALSAPKTLTKSQISSQQSLGRLGKLTKTWFTNSGRRVGTNAKELKLHALYIPRNPNPHWLCMPRPIFASCAIIRTSHRIFQFRNCGERSSSMMCGSIDAYVGGRMWTGGIV
jgi:hypothetical protein